MTEKTYGVSFNFNIIALPNPVGLATALLKHKNNDESI